MRASSTVRDQRLSYIFARASPIVKSLLELARAAESRRIIVANCSEVFLELHRLQYLRAAT
jgi:hypothetical protein